MKPPGKTTFDRMHRAALNEAERIEMSQDARVASGLDTEVMPDQVRLRDDFHGVVRLLDAIESEPKLKEAVIERMKRMAEAKAAPALVAQDEAVADAESEADAE
ncbi:hypothetical protein [Bradyrhizobium sp. SZCCHNRI2049]|uniref:hypothetical protein n=1 Tax=Bradyrhizobium sp. SZCCHNRI2049 TaxID=3057287 RepID=UPI0029170E3F|nr:hypothetical protein [Bradyrhizobium sp. SZCCHNRI2049]